MDKLIRWKEIVHNFNANDYIPLIHDFTWSMPTVAIIIYILIVYYGPSWMKYREKMERSLWLWNLFMSFVSAILFIGMVLPCASFALKKGVFEIICLPRGELYRGSQFFWAWIYALTKYIELLDTVFVVLRKRKITFLHYYHHITVLLYTWFTLVSLPGGSGFIFSVMNSGVHSLMYFYYYLSHAGYRPSWGQIITVIQLLQMVAGVIISALWWYFYVTTDDCNCAHPYFYIIISFALYGSYFILFLQFYLNRYFRKRKMN